MIPYETYEMRAAEGRGRVVDAKGLFRRVVRIELLVDRDERLPRFLELPDRNLQIGDWVLVTRDFSGKFTAKKVEEPFHE